MIGRSLERRAIRVYRAHPPKPGGTLLLGGIHGDERATVALLERFIEWLAAASKRQNVLVVPVGNPDGYARNIRYNARGVDLNRNCETRWTPESEEPPGPGPWSEPESRALRDLILRERPARIVVLHWALGEIEADGPQSNGLALSMWEALTEPERAPYRIRLCQNAGDRTLCPGSLGQWCGWDLRYPDRSVPAMVTLELPYDPLRPRPDALPDDHLETVRNMWAENAGNYLAPLEDGVKRMLAAACGA